MISNRVRNAIDVFRKKGRQVDPSFKEFDRKVTKTIWLCYEDKILVENAQHPDELTDWVYDVERRRELLDLATGKIVADDEYVAVRVKTVRDVLKARMMVNVNFLYTDEGTEESVFGGDVCMGNAYAACDRYKEDDQYV